MTQHPPLFPPGSRPSIAIVVQGRFHAFALAREMMKQGADVILLTNYPKFVARKFGLPGNRVHSLPLHGLLQREAYQRDWPRRSPWLEKFLHTSFSRWAGKVLTRHPRQVIHCFSGVALDMFQELRRANVDSRLMLARGSAHILEQNQLLMEEEARSGTFIDKPSRWMIERELREYEVTDNIVTLSSFARDSFLKRGFDPAGLSMMPLATDTSLFRPTEAQLNARRARLADGGPLRALGTGSFCLRKGALDFVAVARELAGVMKFTWVGNISPDVISVAEAARPWVEFLPRVPERDLPSFYHDADLYFFPTIEDGFAVTLCQAQAACMPVVSSLNCAAPDLVRPGNDGWLFAARDRAQMLQHLRAAHEDRGATLAMVESLWQRPNIRSWEDVARDFIGFVGGY